MQALDVPGAADGGTAGGSGHFLSPFLFLRLSSRLSKCPGLPFLFVLFNERLCLSRSLWNSWCTWPTVLSPLRIAEEIVGIPAPQRGGNWSLQGPLPGQSSTLSPLPERISERIVEQIAVPSPVERISERIVEQIAVPSPVERISTRIVEQIAVSSPAERISERTAELIVDISPGDDRGQRSSSSAGPADEDFRGVFRTFSPPKKVRSAGQVSADLPRHVSSSTPAAYETSNGSDEWIQLTDDEFRTYYWNRRSGESVWRSPAGVEVVWVGVQDDDGDFWYWHRRTGVRTYVLPPLPPG